MKSICKVRSRLEGFLGLFFLVQLVFWLQALSGAGVHSGTGHHGASQGLTGLSGHGGAGHHGASQGLTGLMAAQGITRPLKASRGFMASPGAPQRPGVHRASLELHSQAAHFGPGT